MKFLIEYTLNKLRSDKCNKIILILFLVIMIITMVGGNILVNSLNSINKIDNQKQYGHWYMMIDDITREDYQNIIDSNQEYLYDEYEACFVDIINQDVTQRIAKVESNYYELLNYKIIKGTTDIKDNEVVVTKQYLDSFNTPYKLNTSITVNKHKYVIKGIVDSPNDSEVYYLPGIIVNSGKMIYSYVITNGDIITGFELGSSITRESNSDMISAFDQYQIHYNEYGYDISYFGQLVDSFKTSFIWIEIFIVLAIISVCFIQMMINEQTHQLALLRGIGATKKQLTQLSLIEFISISIIGLILGVFLSFVLSYLIIYIYHLLGHTMVFSYSLRAILLNIVIVCVVYSFCFMFPYRKANKKVLAGVFDQDEFKVISVRRNKLKRQTLHRIAGHFTVLNGKLSIISIIIMLCVINVGFFALYYPNKRYEYQGDLQQLKELRRLIISEYDTNHSLINKMNTSTIQSYKQLSCEFIERECKLKDNTSYYNDYQSIGVITRNDIMDDDDIVGEYPTKDNEILLSVGCTLNKDDDFRNIELNDQIIIDNKTYTVVGYVKSKSYLDHMFDYYYLPYGAMFVSQNTYNKLVKDQDSPSKYIYYYIDTIDQQNAIYNQYQKIQNDHLKLDNEYDERSSSINSEGSLYVQAQDEINTLINQANQGRKNMSILVMILTGIYFIIDVFNNIKAKKEYYMLRIIGITKKELIIMQFYRTLNILITGTIILTIMVFLYSRSYPSLHFTWYYIIVYLVVEMLVFMIIHIMSILPIINKKDLMNELYKE